jgi:hypothetical protein
VVVQTAFARFVSAVGAVGGSTRLQVLELGDTRRERSTNNIRGRRSLTGSNFVAAGSGYRCPATARLGLAPSRPNQLLLQAPIPTESVCPDVP